MPERIEELAPAKVNLTLEVLGRRADGFHELRSLVAFARDCGDRLTLDLDERAEVAVEGPFAAAIMGENLLERALALLRAREPRLRLGRVRLDKRLPVAAGIGGGSADAAALLRAVRRANPELAGGVDWHGLAHSLGSDVPVCLEGAASLMEGAGERLTPVGIAEPLAAVLVNPMAAVPHDKTRRVFHALGLAAGTLAEAKPRPPVAFARASDLVAHMRATGNALTEPALRVLPEAGEVLAVIERSGGAMLAQLSGAGPTCFGIYPAMADAQRAVAVIAGGRPGWWSCATLIGASGC